MKKEYMTEVYNAGKTVLFTFLFIISFSLLSITIGIYLKIAGIAVIGFIIAIILPYAFEKKVKKLWFTRRYLLEFDNSSIYISKYHSNSNIVSKQLNIAWHNIKSYKFNFGGAKTTILTIYLKKGGSKVWSFKDNKTFQEAISGESIFTIFRTYVKDYNSDKYIDNKIVLSKGILNSKVGTIILYSEIAIILSGFIFHLTVHPQSSFLTLFIGVGLFTQLYIRRKQDKELYDKISKLDELH